MAAIKSNTQKYRRSENLFKSDFILPTKTNNAIKIVAPSLNPSSVVSPSASKCHNAASSHNGSNDSPSQEVSLFISTPPKMGKPKFLDWSPSTTRRSATEQAPEEGSSRETSVPPSISHSPNAQLDGGLDTTQIDQAPRAAAESTLDIYANNYVPVWQTTINESPATQIRCCPLSTVDYATYISSFAGSRALSTVPPIRLPPIHTVPCRISSRPGGLLPQQYGEYFSDALQNEIAAQLEVLKTSSMYNVTFEVEDLGQQLYGFTIPGLREHSPRVDLGDVVKIRPLTAVPPQPHFLNQAGNLDLTPRFSGFEFDAIVWGISRPKERIVLRMDGFMPSFSRTCNIIFAFQEHQFAPLWRSIELTANSLNGVKDPSSPWLRQMLFPDKGQAKLQSSLSPGKFKLTWFDSQMNFEQQKAVDAVVTANYGCVPYLISGPPGTGKTKTMVETALQLLQSETSELVPHLLLCAPSDPAADTLATRLSVHLDPSSMFRLNGCTRSFAEVPGSLLQYTNVENNLFSLPDFETMMSYKVVVMTCKDANMLVQARLTNEALIHLAQKPLSAIAPKLSRSINSKQLIHWTALLLDEAAQAVEPEALLPLSLVDPAFSTVATGAASPEWSHPIPQLVMAGDEYQLGPRLSLKSASPLSTSLFARLFAQPLYSAHPLSRANASKPLTSAMLPMLRPAFTNLIRNYRSHPAILTVPSVLFYADSLIAERTMLSDVVRKWPGWRQAGSVGGSTNAAVANIKAGEVELANAQPQTSGCWPVLFVNNSGSDALESILVGAGRGAGGLFNANEASIALSIVQSLLSHPIPLPATKAGQGGLPNMSSNEYASPVATDSYSIQPREIVVMSPFREQVNYLRKAFREVGLYEVNIGPLEAFQGLESRIVIFCTTRTRLGTDEQGRDTFVREDQARGLGVIGEHKRFNVAITRAKEGLIVIGNKECLTCTEDEAWVEFLAFCERNGIDHSPTKLSQQYSVSGTRWQGRLERALRYAENLGRSRREAEYKDDGVDGRSPTGFGYPNRQKSSRNRLRGNMPSLEENMFREGLKIADEMVDNTMYGTDYEEICSHDKCEDAQSSLMKNAQQLPSTDVKAELSRGDTLPPMMLASNGESSTPHIQLPTKAVGDQNETLGDISNTPESTGSGAPGAGADTATQMNREALSEIQFGSFQGPVPTKTGEKTARGAEDLHPPGKDKADDFDRDPEAEFEKADCATQ